MRQELFNTDEGITEITLDLAVCIDPEHINEDSGTGDRISNYLNSDYWASVFLCSVESKDSELLGHVGSQTFGQKHQRPKFETFEHRKRNSEGISVQQMYKNAKSRSKSYTAFKEPNLQFGDKYGLKSHKQMKINENKFSNSNLYDKSKSLKLFTDQNQYDYDNNNGNTDFMRQNSKERFEKLKNQWAKRISEHQEKQFDKPLHLDFSHESSYRTRPITVGSRIGTRSGEDLSSDLNRLNFPYKLKSQVGPMRNYSESPRDKSPYSALSSPGPVTERSEKHAHCAYNTSKLSIQHDREDKSTTLKELSKSVIIFNLVLYIFYIRIY